MILILCRLLNLTFEQIAMVAVAAVGVEAEAAAVAVGIMVILTMGLVVVVTTATVAGEAIDGNCSLIQMTLSFALLMIGPAFARTVDLIPTARLLLILCGPR